MSARALALALALLLMISSCAPEEPPEPAVTVSATEERTSPPETDEPTAEATKEETSAPEVTTEPEETTESFDITSLSPEELLLLADSFGAIYSSYVRISHTEADIDIMGDQEYIQLDSELRVKGENALYRRGYDGDFSNFHLVGGELYCEGVLAKYRIGGYDKKAFLSEFSEILPLTVFTGGSAEYSENGIELKFTSITEAGSLLIREKLALSEEYAVDIVHSELLLTLDGSGHMKESSISISFSLIYEGEEQMTVSLSSECEQSGINEDVSLELPRAEDYIYFSDSASAELYEALCAQITGFTSSHSKYEYKVRDDMLIKSDKIDLPLTSNSVYAYNYRIGASIEKAFDIADGTGPHKTLTHYNFRRGFSQIDGGSIFVDTTVNANNLDYTLSRPFATSFFSAASCTGMDMSRTKEGRIVFTLTEKTAKSIAGDLLLRAGILSAPTLSGVSAYTYIEYGADGRISSIGYEFSASAAVSGQSFKLERSVELEIVSTDSANVKVIYIDVEDDDE